MFFLNAPNVGFLNGAKNMFFPAQPHFHFKNPLLNF